MINELALARPIGSKTVLAGVEEVVLFKEVDEVFPHAPFHDLGNGVSQGNWVVVCWGFLVLTLVDGSYCCRF